MHKASAPRRKRRKDTLRHRLSAAFLLTAHIQDADPDRRAAAQAEWDGILGGVLNQRTWGDQQLAFLRAVKAGGERCDANGVDESQRWLYLGGSPGTGKTEVLLHAAATCAADGLNVCVMVPTGSLASTFKERLPDSDRITVQTLHSGLRIIREEDAITKYQPPTYLKQFDVFFIDECSQIDDAVGLRLLMAVKEMSRAPLVVLAGDFQQLAPVSGGR
eukprot:9290938-Pyramimonas_sp.AAC.1